MVSPKSCGKVRDDFFMEVAAPFGYNATGYVPAAEDQMKKDFIVGFAGLPKKKLPQRDNF